MAKADRYSAAAQLVAWTLGRNMLRRRTQLGFTRTEIASEVGVTYGAIANYERGDVLPSVSTLVGIAVALSVEPSWLLTKRDDDE